MKFVKIKLLQKKPLVVIDKNWFPYRNIVNNQDFEEVCAIIEEEIRFNGRRKVAVYYNIEESDDKGRPMKIKVGCSVNRNPNDGHDCIFNTIYDKEPLKCTHTLHIDSTVDPFVFKRFMEDEVYLKEGNN